MILKPFPNEKFPNKKIPHNPCINAGAISCTSMVKPDLNISEKYD